MNDEVCWHLRQSEIIGELYDPCFMFKQFLTFGLYGRKHAKLLQKEFDELHEKIMRGVRRV